MVFVKIIWCLNLKKYHEQKKLTIEKLIQSRIMIFCLMTPLTRALS